MNNRLVIIKGNLELGSTLTAYFYNYQGVEVPYSSIKWYGCSKLPTDPNSWLSSLFYDDQLLSETNSLYITHQSYQFIKCIIDGVSSQLLVIDALTSSDPLEKSISKLDIFGKGIDLRTPINPLSHQANIATDINRINQSLYLILTTSKGEVPMLPNFGSDLASSLFEVILPEDIPSIEISVRTDIESQEPRVSINDISVEFNDLTHVLRLQISYNIIGTNIGSNFIYNKQLGEGVA